jgi:hypothetical protein
MVEGEVVAKYCGGKGKGKPSRYLYFGDGGVSINRSGSRSFSQFLMGTTGTARDSKAQHSKAVTHNTIVYS